MKAANDTPRREPTGQESIRELVLNEAAAAILAAGRELTEGEPLSVREFLRGPALKVGLALSVMGVTMWVAEMNAEHRRREQRERSSMAGLPTARRRGGRRRQAPAGETPEEG